MRPDGVQCRDCRVGDVEVLIPLCWTGDERRCLRARRLLKYFTAACLAAGCVASMDCLDGLGMAANIVVTLLWSGAEISIHRVANIRQQSQCATNSASGAGTT